MTRLQVNLEAIQHVTRLTLDLDLSSPGLVCLVGRNGTGKTTLIRALRNLSSADTFIRTATPHAFSPNSRIRYSIDGRTIEFSYDNRIRSLNCKEPIPDEFRNIVAAELPMPHGSRFNYFKSASESDLDIRKAIALGDHESPTELISFLESIYGTDRYSGMVAVKAKGKTYYAVVRKDGTYIREDYLSSGEYFLINLYRTIKGRSRLIAIDEIDISLDCAAQAHLAQWLRAFCHRYECKILFTTHSLALMRKLEPTELFYVEDNKGEISITPTSFSYAKARLFGFSGCDRYILTEDEVLLGFIEAVIQKYCTNIFFRYRVIFIGGGSQVVALMKHNEKEEFLSSPDKVIAVIDGDQRNEKFARNFGVHLIPIDSVEKALYLDRLSYDFPFKTSRDNFSSPKDFHHHLKEKKIATQEQIFKYLLDKYDSSLQNIAEVLRRFLTSPSDRLS
ncbi:ATP-binding protein [Achromobacter mucicolens]|uniref:ATP-dependent nuclease n=1 Tax=Achromobacter mucicolens TaxID=1389922 RepID=UPI00244AC695|nr:AAA family ATPase [Achromobacter mucicolens]MDH0090413.1 ATP-binding protein [Achromobacter mucicolens]